MESLDHELCDDDPYGFFHQADEAWDHSDMCVSWSPVPTEHIQNLYLDPCMHIWYRLFKPGAWPGWSYWSYCGWLHWYVANSASSAQWGQVWKLSCHLGWTLHAWSLLFGGQDQALCPPEREAPSPEQAPWCRHHGYQFTSMSISKRKLDVSCCEVAELRATPPKPKVPWQKWLLVC